MMLSSKRCKPYAISWLFLWWMTAVGAAELPLGAIVMQFRSSVKTEAAALNKSVEAVTTDFLNQYFRAYYTRGPQKDLDYFQQVELTTNSLGVHGVKGSYITTIEIGGKLSFNTEKDLPSSLVLENLLKNAFSGQNEQLYLGQLQKKDTDEFLQNLTYLIIDINDTNVAESLLREDGTLVRPTMDTTTLSSTNVDERWIRVMIYVGSIGLVLVLLACTCFLYHTCRSRRAAKKKENNSKDQQVADEESGGDEPIKIIHLPVKKKKTSLFVSTDDREGISPTSSGTMPTLIGSLSDQTDIPPPSPQRSLASHCSSIFTYGDNRKPHGKSRNVPSDTISRAPSVGSRFSLDMPSIDLGAWRGGKEDPPAFGADISVIEAQKDLSLIPEERSDIESSILEPREERRGRNKPVVSRNSRAGLNVRQSQSRSSYRSESYFYNGNLDMDGVDPLDTSTDDVICDLKNLSMQIQRQRSSRRR